MNFLIPVMVADGYQWEIGTMMSIVQSFTNFLEVAGQIKELKKIEFLSCFFLNNLLKCGFIFVTLIIK